jgi:beta-N-acetylhexosaminidase
MYQKLLYFLISFILLFESQLYTQLIPQPNRAWYHSKSGFERPMTLDEKIGQLFIIPACQLQGEDHSEDLQRLIREGRAGGILLKQGTSEGQKAFIKKLQGISPVPLLCLQDGEWGLAMRLSDVISFPKNLTLGAVQDLFLLYQLGEEIGLQCSLVGAHINLAPVVDVNSNSLNPIIHMRSFGEDPFQVAVRGEMIMKGMQSKGIYACAKHFPGHGDTSVDSHVDLPYVAHDREQLEKIELFPFRWLIHSGVRSIMSAHLYVNALAEDFLLPATFSRRIITSLLQNDLEFRGLIISDALNMKALAKRYSVGQTVLQTLLAGHDLLLYGDHIAPNIDQILRRDLPEAFAVLKAAVETGEISEEEIDARVRKVLEAKRELGLFEKFQEEDGEPIAEKINSPAAYALKKRLFEEAVTVVRNEGLLPLSQQKVALIEWGESAFFKAALEQELKAESIALNDPQLFIKIQECSCAVIALSKAAISLPDFELELNEKALFNALGESRIPIVGVVFGTPYSLKRLPLFSAIVVAYENEKEAQEAAADIVLGKLSPKGRLPISVKPHFDAGTGLCW